VPASAGGVVPSGEVASGAGGISDGVGLGAGSAGIVLGAVSAGGVVMSALSSFLAQPAASNRVDTASKAKARMASSSRRISDQKSGPLLSGSRSRWFQRVVRHDECQCFVNDNRCVDHRVIFIMRA
jgi:hypothetical protein